MLLHYFATVRDEFGAQPHPLEHWMLYAHGLAAFAALALGGWLWAVHVAPAWKLGRRRRSGIVLFVAAIVLAATGYLLYYAGDDRVRTIVSLVHWIVGLAFGVVAFAHAHSTRRRRARPRCSSE